MRREEKNAIIDSLAEKLKEYSHFYLTDTAQLNAADTSDLRRKCFENDIKLIVVKNTLLKRALEQSDGNFEELYPVLERYYVHHVYTIRKCSCKTYQGIP
ncbi:MAG: 50S ribosomal protein L10 [Marinilabiliales bacterium]|nr:50S ribosomal protein L10 [Marinilabiliales bacterium]